MRRAQVQAPCQRLRCGGTPRGSGALARRAWAKAGRGRAAAALVLVAAVAAPACRDPAAGPGRLSGRLPPLPVYRAVRAAAPPPLDADADAGAWGAAEPVVLVDSLTGAPPRYATVARLLWDDTWLHVAFRCEDDLAWVNPARERDGNLWEDEVVEVFLDPRGDGHGYVELELTPAGVLFDARFAARRSELAAARAWSSGARTAVRVDGALTSGGEAPRAARGWTAQLAVPWSALGMTPRVGVRLRMNLYRLEAHNRLHVAEGTAFSPPLRGDFHALDRFGWLELAAGSREGTR